MRQCTALLAWLALAAAAPLAAAATPDAWLKAEVLVDRTAVARGDAFRMAVVLEIGRGYHVNANPAAEDFLIPTVVRPEPHPAVTWGHVAYPAGRRLSVTWAESGGISVYQGKAVIVLEAAAADDAPTGPTILRLHLSYQGCDADTCYQPGERTLEVRTQIVATEASPKPPSHDIFLQYEAPKQTEKGLRTRLLCDREAVRQGTDFSVALVLNLDEGSRMYRDSARPDKGIPTTLEPQPHPFITWGKVHYPGLPSVYKDGIHVVTLTSFYSGRALIRVDGTVNTDAPLGSTNFHLLLKGMVVHKEGAYPLLRILTKQVKVVSQDARGPEPNPGYVREVGGLPAFRFEGEADVASWYEQGFLAYLGLLLLAGLALNLTPCVFPLIPVTMNVFAQQGEKRPLKVLTLAVVYVLGLAVTFAALGVLAALAGKSLGMVLQSPWGVLGVVTVMAAMMASAFGAFEIQLPSGAMGKLGARRGLFGAGFMGMVMGAIAAPCVGPFLIALIAFIATRRSVLLGGVSFFVTGLGLGLPYVLLGTFTSLINRFPRGGAWLIWVKRLLGLALAALILYFIQPYVAPAFFWPMVLGLFVFAAVFLGLLEGQSRRPFTKRFWAVRIGVAALILAAGIGFYARYAPAAGQPGATPAASSDGPHVEWTPWQEGALRNAAAAGEPALLYFGATWCTECRTWKAHIFTNPEVVEASKGLVRIYVDVSRAPEGAKRRFSDTYRGTNPPAVIVFGRDGRIVTAYRNPPSPEAFLRTLKRAAPEM